MIPVWGGYAGERLENAVRSVAGQDRSPDVLLVDNASDVELPPPAGTEVIRSSARLTLGAARNLGLERVRTPYVLFWDADDLMLDGTVAFLEDRLDQDPRLVAFGLAIVEQRTGERHRWPRKWLGALTRAPRALALVDCLWSVFPTTGATAMRTEVVREARGFADADSGEDWCLGVSLMFRGRVGWSERAGRVYLTRPESVWARHSTARHQFAHAAVVRRRMASDRAVPAWGRRLLPVIAVGQTAAITAHLLVARLRRGR